MVDTRKFSEFLPGGDLEPNDTTVGLEGGNNTKFINIMPLLAPGTTAERPLPSAAINYRLRFNTTFESYEYYSPTNLAWIQIEDSDDISDLIDRLASHLPGDGASMIGLEDQGAVVNKTVQDLANAPLIANTDTGVLSNGQFLSPLATGFVTVTNTTGILNSKTLSGAPNQIAITPNDGTANPVFSLTNPLVLEELTIEDNVISSHNPGTDINIIPSSGKTIFNGTYDFVTGTGVIPDVLTLGSPGVTNGNFAAASYGTLSGGNFNGFRSRSTTPGTYVSVQPGDLLARFRSYADDGTQFLYCGLIEWVAEAPISTGVIPTSFYLQTNNYSGAPTTQLRIRPDGTVDLAKPLPIESGGTGASLTPSDGGIYYSTATNAAILPGTATAGQMLQSGASSAPAWSTATYPATTTVNQLLYSSAANVISGVTVVNNAGLTTTAGGVPTWVAATGTGSPVRNISPSLVTPALGVASATSVTFPAGTPLSSYDAVGVFAPTVSLSPKPPRPARRWRRQGVAGRLAIWRSDLPKSDFRGWLLERKNVLRRLVEVWLKGSR